MNEVVKIEFDGTFNIKEILIEGITYVLSGYCSNCGKCCIYPLYDVGFNDENGCCSKLMAESIDNKIVYKCSIYNSRPVGCLLWPSNFKELEDIPECTYKLVKKVM